MARIFQINVSDGGVPKQAIPSARINRLGLEGDRQIHLHVHGGEERAVCLYSLEIILALQEEGHPIFPGSTGENITITGMDWEKLIPGLQLRLGKHVELELTKYAIPCDALTPYFKNGSVNRIFQDENAGWSRICAKVIREGTISTGDSIVLLN